MISTSQVRAKKPIPTAKPIRGKLETVSGRGANLIVLGSARLPMLTAQLPVKYSGAHLPTQSVKYYHRPKTSFTIPLVKQWLNSKIILKIINQQSFVYTFK